MEMELGLKLTRAADEFSSTEFQFAKDRAGSLFQSTETDTMFILSVHLKGYTKKNIKIDINEEGTIIAIRGEKLVQETVMVGWKLVKKDVEIRKFSKAFKIPDGVILDKIKARYDEEKSILTIEMPKKVKGILGIEFVEVEEDELITRQGTSEDLSIVADKIPKKVTFKDDMDKPTSSADSESTKKEEENQEKEKKEIEEKIDLASSIRKPREEVEKHVVKDEVTKMEKELMPKIESNIKGNDTIQEIREPQSNQLGGDKTESTSSRDEPKDDQDSERANGILEKEEDGEISRKREGDNVPKKSSKICVPIVAGSALILSLVVFVIHLIRTKNQSGKRKG
ncbi:uncharacterized protein LOC107781517 [Nicotiana tabacum]|uniref:Microtubule-associated protein 1B-like n=1 Tax=Nicotiana tabacum TaxID=4097 RepID=A0A1S3Z0Q7_TOBAC|nr:microtubule-associated protein 1B-like [Nicotiana tomentosiformis]XP_016457716.1 PREDICTED: microtubule-associated protein 1B-like [Nicotiana tabacum]XP_016457717.1 PREDICTED: microtubule-associated protein 1B-like [Nicotiana tabacum]XP_018630672.1 microtubule-associated protein 1B-like [Nicotiana tomentosiformis]